jgi:hypothetical protein
MAKFTPETARLLAARGIEARRANTAKRNDRLKQIDTILKYAAEACEENVRLKAALIAAKPEESEEFRNKRLSRVRKQLDLIDQLIEDEMAKDEPDAGKLDRMANSALRLNEQERQLSNRSLPPTLKANSVKPPRRAASSDSPEPASE